MINDSKVGIYSVLKRVMMLCYDMHNSDNQCNHGHTITVCHTFYDLKKAMIQCTLVFSSISGPCITNVFATRRKNFSQWHRSFQRKLLSHWLKFLRHVAITLVIQGPAGYWCINSNMQCRRAIWAPIVRDGHPCIWLWFLVSISYKLLQWNLSVTTTSMIRFITCD